MENNDNISIESLRVKLEDAEHKLQQYQIELSELKETLVQSEQIEEFKDELQNGLCHLAKQIAEILESGEQESE